MTTATLAPSSTASLIYADSGMDWAQASTLELSIEAGYLREWLRREDSAAAREELKRVLAAASAKELKL